MLITKNYKFYRDFLEFFISCYNSNESINIEFSDYILSSELYIILKKNSIFFSVRSQLNLILNLRKFKFSLFVFVYNVFFYLFSFNLDYF